LKPLIQLAATAGLLVAWAVLLRPQALGGPAEYVVVRGSSMLPTYNAGDLVLVLRASHYQIGEVVAYRVPAGEIGEGSLVIHRIIGGNAERGFVTEGDNNVSPDPWLPRLDNVAGRAVLVIPAIGRFVAMAHQPAISASLATALLVAAEIARRQRPVRRRTVDAATVV
jgi:signal peptidase I